MACYTHKLLGVFKYPLPTYNAALLPAENHSLLCQAPVNPTLKLIAAAHL